MGIDESAIPIGSTKTIINPAIPISNQLTIAIHGKRKVGKTSLIQKMLNTQLNLQYSPTPTMEATEFCWNPIHHPDETIKITIWDVVECAIKNNRGDDNQIFPDANTVDTYSTTDGIIIMYDPDREDTVDYASLIIEKAPERLPIICLANFLDRRNMTKKVPEKLMPYIHRIVHVQTSIFSNRGLLIVAEWLDIPLLYSQEKYLSKRVEQSGNEISQFDKQFEAKIERVNYELFQVGIEDNDDDFDKSDELPSELTNSYVQSFITAQTTTSNSDKINQKKKDTDFMIQLDYSE